MGDDHLHAMLERSAQQQRIAELLILLRFNRFFLAAMT